jgi:hypothetical protein
MAGADRSGLGTESNWCRPKNMPHRAGTVGVAVAKILQFPDGRALRAAGKSTPSGLDLIRYFEDFSVSLQTLQFVYKVISARLRRRKQEEPEWSS